MSKKDFYDFKNFCWNGSQGKPPCKQCREKRRKLNKEEKRFIRKDLGYEADEKWYSYTEPGCWEGCPKFPEKDFDVLLLACAHGGEDLLKLKGNHPEEYNEIHLVNGINDVIWNKYAYHKGKIPIKKFFQYTIYNLIKRLNKDGISWYFTDAVKCFVSNTPRENLIKAGKWCVENYLRKEIKIIKPKLVILFGYDVIEILKDNTKGEPEWFNKKIRVTDHHADSFIGKIFDHES